MRIVRQACITIDSATTHPIKKMYISQDPIGLAGGNPTLYGYVYDPNSWMEVFGLSEYNATEVLDEKYIKIRQIL
jgi:rhs family protein